MNSLTLTFSAVGDNALMGYLPEPVLPSYPLILQQLYAKAKSEDIIDCVVAYHSVLVIFDPKKNDAVTLSEQLENYLSEAIRLSDSNANQRVIRVPVCYEVPYSLDLASVAKHANLTKEELIQRHSGKDYTVCCTGFTPGFAFLGYVDEAIAAPRQDEPRAKIPAGSVGIAGNQTGIYPVDSPGGWQIIGRTPMTLYAPEIDLFSRFEIGDKVQFYAITADEFSVWRER